MVLDEIDLTRIQEVHKNSYGLLPLAQELLAKAGRYYSPETIAKTWENQNLEVGKRSEVVGGFIKKYYEICDGDTLKIQDRLRLETPFSLDTSRIRTYLRELNLTAKTKKEKYVGPYRKKDYTKEGKKLSSDKRKLYRFCDTPEVIT
jgi:hypothetical protein